MWKHTHRQRHTHTHTVRGAIAVFRDYTPHLIPSSLSSTPFLSSSISPLYLLLITLKHAPFSSSRLLSFILFLFLLPHVVFTSYSSSFTPLLFSSFLSFLSFSFPCTPLQFYIPLLPPSRQHLFIMKHTVGRRPRLEPPPRYLLQRLPPARHVC